MKVFVIYIGSLVEGFCGEYYLKFFWFDFDVMVLFNKLLYIVDEDKSWVDVDINILFVVWVCYDDVYLGYIKFELIIEEELVLIFGFVVKVDNWFFVLSFVVLMIFMLLYC